MHMILDPILEWCRSNMDVVFFIYGLSFVVMGISILVQPKESSKFRLAEILWLLAGFGLIHGVNELLDMWRIIKGANQVLDLFRSLILVISYLFLFEFGRRLLCICGQKYFAGLAKVFGWRLTLITGIFVITLVLISADFWNMVSTWSRYLLAFPSGIFICAGLILYYKYEETQFESLGIKKYFFTASIFFLIYGVLGGLIVNRADFFPANLLNTDSFLSAAHIPVQVFRGICAIVIAWAVGGMLRIFNWERLGMLKKEISERKDAQEALKKANDDLEIRVKERTLDLSRAYTKLKNTQGQLIQAEKLNAVGQLASGIAHEVKNPLGIILQGVNFLESGIAANRPDLPEVLTMIKNSIKRANRIVEELHDFSKATSLNLEPQDLKSILEESLNLVNNQLNSKSIAIVKEIDPSLPKALADKIKIEQVFINILLNAIQAIEKNGTITIRACDKEMLEAKDGIGRRDGDHFVYGERAIVVEFIDTGAGITEENLRRIFDPFFTTKGPKEGTGLGLSVSRNIVYMHKGLIRAESQVGKGTKMTVILKIA